MNRLIDKGLEDQTVLLIRMGDLAYQALSISIKSYLEGFDIQVQIREMSDRLMLMADKIEDRTFELITRFQPVASDLRAIKSYMKIGYDFARYGRYALDISYIIDQIGGLNECDSEICEAIEKTCEKALQMVKISIDALRKYDVNLAKTITETEQEVDELYQTHLKKLLEKKTANSKSTISSILMVRYLERIADHAVYVCESILYIVTGEKTKLR